MYIPRCNAKRRKACTFSAAEHTYLDAYNSVIYCSTGHNTEDQGYEPGDYVGG